MLEIVLIINLWGSRNSRPKRNKKERLIFPINSHQDKFDTAHPSFLTTMGKRVISWIQWNIFEINLGYQFWGSDVWWELQNMSCFRIEYENQHWGEESKYRFVIVKMSWNKNQIWTPSVLAPIQIVPKHSLIARIKLFKIKCILVILLSKMIFILLLYMSSFIGINF